MGGHDLGDNGQPEARAAAAACPVAFQTDEPVKDPHPVALGDARAVVGDRHDGIPTIRTYSHLDAGTGVAHRVFEQIAHQPRQCGAVPAQQGGFNHDVDVAVSDAALAHDFAGCDVVELNGFAVGRQPALI